MEPQGAFPADSGPNAQRIVRCAGVSRIPPGFDPDVVVLAVKPQVMDEVVPGYAPFAKPGTVFLSIAAGKTIDYFTARLGGGAAIVRASGPGLLFEAVFERRAEELGIDVVGSRQRQPTPLLLRPVLRFLAA